MSDKVETVKQEYQPFLEDYRVSLSIIGCVVSLILVPAGFTLDWVIYPELFFPFLWIRIACDAFIGLILALHFTKIGRQYIRTLMFLWSLAIQVSICCMIYMTDGSSSTYYAGLNLVVLAIGLVLPFSVSESIAFVIGTLALYTATTYLHTNSDFSIYLYFNNVYFITLTGIISVVAVFFIEKRRFESFQLSFSLAQKNQELQQLDKLKSQFFANISHELRTPLTLILGPIQDLLTSPKQPYPKIEALLKTAKDNGLRLLALVNNLLDLSQAEEGERTLSLTKTDLNIFLSGATQSVRYLAETRDIDISFDQKVSNIHVNADQHALEKIFFNLLSNAIKFTDPGGKIVVTCTQRDDQAVVTVEDTGIGIDEDQLDVIFDRFRQVDGSTTRKYTGTGIGLALVKTFSEALNGHISVSSELDKGTCFTLRFPLAADEENVRAAVEINNAATETDSIETLHQEAARVNIVPVSDASEQHANNSSASHLPRLLIVDDEPGIRLYLLEMLADHYTVFTASDGKRGLEKAREIVPELMVLDCMLPGMDGFEVCRHLKEGPDTQSIKIVLLTARVDEGSKIQALENGADDFLTKPFSKVELVTRLSNLLQTKKLEIELKANNQSLHNAMKELQQLQNTLIQSEKMNALGRLSAGLLHEINNPLNYACTAIQLLKQEPLYLQDEDCKETVDDIDEGMLRINKIISDLRTFASPGDAKQFTEFPIKEALSTALRFTASEIRDMTVIQDIDDRDSVLGSKSQIVQIFVNLITNAASALKKKCCTDNQTIKIFSRIEDDRHYLSVWDNGIGIEPAVINKIFDPFFTTQDVGLGMGLGLSICHTIVENHQGTFSVDSEAGNWTVITFDLQVA